MSDITTGGTKDTNLYWKAAGAIVFLVGAAYLYSKFADGRKKNNVLSAADDKKKLDEITKASDLGTPLNKSAFDEKSETPVAEVLSPQHEEANAIRDNAFQKGAEDIAQPTVIVKEKEKKKEPVAPKQSNKVPPNAFIGADGNAQGVFTVGDVVWSYKDQNVSKAKVIGGNIIDRDKDGNGFGSVAYKHNQKLGVIQSLTPNGAYLKLAPDFRGYGFVDFRGMFKLM